MKPLVLGGTVLVSREVAAAAVRRGRQLTCVHRGRSGRVSDGAGEVVLDRDEPGAIRALTGPVLVPGAAAARRDGSAHAGARASGVAAPGVTGRMAG